MNFFERCLLAFAIGWGLASIDSIKEEVVNIKHEVRDIARNIKHSTPTDINTNDAKLSRLLEDRDVLKGEYNAI